MINSKSLNFHKDDSFLTHPPTKYQPGPVSTSCWSQTTYPDDFPDSTLVHAAPVLVGKTTNPWVPYHGVNERLLCTHGHPLNFTPPSHETGRRGKQQLRQRTPQVPTGHKVNTQVSTQVLGFCRQCCFRWTTAVSTFRQIDGNMGYRRNNSESWRGDASFFLELKPWGKVTQISDCSNVVGDLAREL